jgi:hypothetical protein
VAYGAGSWTPKNKMEKKNLNEVRRENIEKNIWAPYEYGYWRIKMNRKSYCKFICPDIVPVITVRRLESVGHVVTLDGIGTVKTSLKAKQEEDEKEN